MKATSKPMVGQCHSLLVWALFGMVVVLTLINLYQGWVIAHQMQVIRTLYEVRFPG